MKLTRLVGRIPGSFPSSTDLSVIDEGSYRTSLDNDSLRASSVQHSTHEGTIDDDDSLSGRSSTALKMVDEDSGPHSIADDEQGGSAMEGYRIRRGQKLTGIAINCSLTTNLGTFRTLNKSNQEELHTEHRATQFELPNPSFLEHSNHFDSSHSSPEKRSSCTPHLPFWLKLAVGICFVLVVGSISIGIAAAQRKPTPQLSNDENQGSMQHALGQQFGKRKRTSSPTAQPSLSPVKEQNSSGGKISASSQPSPSPTLKTPS